jgi:hypothetical protein
VDLLGAIWNRVEMDMDPYVDPHVDFVAWFPTLLVGDCLRKFNIKECRDLVDVDHSGIDDEEAVEDIDAFFEAENEQD